MSLEAFGVRIPTRGEGALDDPGAREYPIEDQGRRAVTSQDERRSHLEESIHHLREELADGEPLSAEDRALLDRTLADMEVLLDEEQEDPSFGGALYQELREIAVRMEQARPNLSTLVGRIVDSLSQLGI